MNGDSPQGFHLLGIFDWLTGHNYVISVLLLLLLTPVGMILAGLVGELRLVPLDPRKQFLGFIIGDVFLAFGIGIMLVLVQKLPGGQWYDRSWLHFLVLGITIGIAIGMTASEIRTKFYPLGAILSPTKLYHNFLLYGGYVYVAVLLLAACITGMAIGVFNVLDVVAFVGAMLLVGLWLACVLLDGVSGFIGQIPQTEKAHLAHIDKWWEAWPTAIYNLSMWLRSWIFTRS